VHLSDKPALHMANPASAVMSDPTRSLWQSGAIGILLIAGIDWSMATGKVAAATAVKW
jgi:hypothetical protein